MIRKSNQRFKRVLELGVSAPPGNGRSFLVHVGFALAIIMVSSSALATPGLEKLFGFVDMAGEAIGSLVDGIEKGFHTGTRIYDDLSIREKNERLLDLSSNLSHLGMIQTEFVETLGDFNEQPEVEKWERLTDNLR